VTKADDYPHKKIAKITATTLGLEGHGILTAMLTADYGGSGQGVGGFALDAWSEEHKRRVSTSLCGAFITGVLRACGVDSWERVKGRTVYVLFENDSYHSRPIGLAPLPTEDGSVFLFETLKAIVP
jgi:hypothetical protein